MANPPHPHPHGPGIPGPSFRIPNPIPHLHPQQQAHLLHLHGLQISQQMHMQQIQMQQHGFGNNGHNIHAVYDDPDEPMARISRMATVVSKCDSWVLYESTVNGICYKLDDEGHCHYVVRAFHTISNNLVDVFKNLTCGHPWSEAGKDELIRLINRLHKALQIQGPCDKMTLWLIELITKKGRYKRGRALHIQLMHDVFIALLNDMSRAELERVPVLLVRGLEKVDSSHSFKLLCTVFGHCVNTLQSCETQCFADFVDVVIGWMVDEECKDDNSQFCQDYMLLLRSYFVQEPAFCRTLICTIIDDLETGATVDNMSSNAIDLTQAVRRVSFLVKAYCTMLRINSVDEKQFVHECTEKVVVCALNVLNYVFCSSDRRQFMVDILCLTNEAIFLSSGADGPNIRTFIKTEIERLCTYGEWTEWSYQVLVKMWEGICTWIEGVVSVTQLSEDTMEIANSLMVFLDGMRDEKEKVLLIQALFRTRNVQLLLKVYQWHLAKLNPDDKTSVLYVLAGLSDIAGNKSGSTLALYALQPSIFEFLIRLATSETESTVKQSVLNMLKMHSVVHSHWVSSLSLTIKSEYSAESPGARFLPTLMYFWLAQLSQEGDTRLWILEWILEFLTSSAAFATAMFKTNPSFFEHILKFVCFGARELVQYCANLSVTLNKTPEAEGSALSAFVLTPPVNNVPAPIVPGSQAVAIINLELEPSRSWPYVKAAKKLLDMYCDPESTYYQVDGLQKMVSSLCKTFVFTRNTQIPWEIYPLLLEALNRLPTFFLTETRLRRDKSDSILAWAMKLAMPTATEEGFGRFLIAQNFLDFIYQLSASDEDSKVYTPRLTRRPLEDPSPDTIRAAVDFLIRSKLKTPMGRPQELFGQIQTTVRRKGVLAWKLEFVFLLEQSFLLWISGTHTINLELHDTIRTFYQTNRTPCMEWLRRIRTDLIEACFDSQCYYDAFYHSAMGDDLPKAKLALWHIQDMEGVHANDPTMKAGWHYMRGEFETALEIIRSGYKEGDALTEELNKVVYARSTALLSTNYTELLNPFVQDNKVDFLISKKEAKYSFLESQLNFIQTKSSVSLDACGFKKSFDVYDTEMDTWTLLKVCNGLRFLPSIPYEEKRKVWLLFAEKMVENGNLEFCEVLLTQLGINWDTILGGIGSSFFNSLPEYIEPDTLENQNIQLLQITAHYLIQKKEMSSVISIYDKLFSLAQVACNPDDEKEVHWRREVFSDFRKHIDEIPSTSLEFAKAYALDAGTFDHSSGDRENCEAFAVSSLKLGLIKKVMELQPQDSEPWMDMGDSFYDYQLNFVPSSSEEKEDLERLRFYKQRALLSYCLYLTNMKHGSTSGGAKDATIMKVISRVITLVKEDETLLEYSPESIMKSKLWLDFLPHVAQIPALRASMLECFPEQSAMYLWSRAAGEDGNGSISTAALNRKGVLSSLSSSIVDINDDEYTHAPYHVPCSSCETEGNASTASVSYVAKSPLKIDQRIQTLARELLRIGTTPEELWTWNTQRSLGDWHRRVSALKKDMARDPDPAKIVAYTLPVVKYLLDLWKWTARKADSPAEFQFILKYADVIPAIANAMLRCTNVQSLTEEYKKLLLCTEKFDATALKTPLGRLSPTLENFERWGRGVTLLGIPDGVTIVNIVPVVCSLATKTRPKKIRFIGSNGKHYEYLVKGNENLNVDAGMMEFFTVCRTFLKQPLWTYAVTPLGTRGGLIQMVKGIKPVFHLYKKYLLGRYGGEKTSTSDLYWRTMFDYGVKTREREAAEIQTLKLVYTALKQDSPKDLISREFLLTAPNSRRWFEKVKSFTRDSGVTCAVGHLLGIGDRHLDNILVNIEDGRLIHVDFSLVFSRGEKLKVPEVVPFRLTQNFRNALQYPGANGSYLTYMKDAFLKFQENSELALFCAENIAFSCQMEEDFLIEPTSLRVAEVESSFSILILRYKNMLRTLQIQKMKMLGAANDIANLSKWRRILANLDPFIILLASAVSENSRFGPFKALVIEKWGPEVSHFWLHQSTETLLTLKHEWATQCEILELTLQEIFHAIYFAIKAKPEDKPGQKEEQKVGLAMNIQNEEIVPYDPNLEFYQESAVVSLLNKFSDKLNKIDVNNSSVEQLISEAASDINLFKMFEGWTPWI